ncbi:helix-turn-helix domain-containing protein [Streptomyces sp. P1-3]|uniref:helix-turn-helix domain-containing protein n=1 Tax=Streptomyces sp. P1-3 TaxID=3421658 RepID=UPI003D35D2FD
MAVVGGGSPLTARRKFGAELRILRDRLGLTLDEVGAEINCHNSKISRIELGKRTCTRKDLEALMDLYEVSEEKREELADLFARSKQRTPPWWQAYADVVVANYAEFLSYEAEASLCREYQQVFIPAMLQAPDYARAVTVGGTVALGPDQVDTLVEVRLRRQERLREDVPMRHEAVITEAALHMRMGGAQVMRAQLRHLRDVATAYDNISLRVLPFAAEVTATAMGAFSLFASGQGIDPDAAWMESASGLHFRDDPFIVRRMNRIFGNLSDAALSEHDSLELIERVEKELVQDE